MYLDETVPAPDSPPRSTCETRTTRRLLEFSRTNLLPPPADRHILVAVSGGSDSMALLHLLADWRETAGCSLTVATVDHGLRPDSRAEAEFVADTCRTLTLPHTILTWRRTNADACSSSAARAARYALLHAHAYATNATAIALGHTRDDQAETVTMRAARLSGSARATNGLAGMAARTALVIDGKSIDLYRPLLAVSRDKLRAELTARQQGWCDDPTNMDRSFERVRIRANLARQTGVDTTQRGRFAALCGRSRVWLAEQTARYLETNASVTDSGIHLAYAPREDEMLAPTALAAIIRRMGHNAHPVSVEKLRPVMQALQQGETMRHAVGRCLLTIKRNAITIQPEHRAGRVVVPLYARYAPQFDSPLDAVLDRLLGACRTCAVNP